MALTLPFLYYKKNRKYPYLMRVTSSLKFEVSLFRSNNQEETFLKRFKFDHASAGTQL